MHKDIYFRALIEKKLKIGECLTQLYYIQLAMQLFKITGVITLAGVAQLVGASPCKLKGRRLDPWSGPIKEATYGCFSLSLSPLPLSLKSMNISSGKD